MNSACTEMFHLSRAGLTAFALLLVSGIYADTLDIRSKASVDTDFRVREVQVTASKAERSSSTYRLIATISQQEIAALPVHTIADILQYLPGLDVRHRGANDAQCDLSMRGGTFDQVQLMLNGVPLTDAQTGHYTLHLPLSTLLIERIEVLQDAVNIVTRSQQSAGSSQLSAIRLTAGMNGSLHPEAALTAQVGEWQLNASADYSRSDGYYAPSPSERESEALTNNSCRRANIYLQTRWRDLDVQLGAQYKDAGAGLFYGSSTDQFDATRTAFASARYRHHWGAWSLQAQAAYRANYDHYEWHHGQPADSNTHLTQAATGELQAAYISWLGTTTVGLDLRNENIRSTNLGDTNRINLTYFARQTFHYDRLNASIDVSGIYNTYFGNHYTCSANIGYEYLPGCSAYLNAGRTLRMPTFTDLNYDAGSQLGNPNLQPEKIWTFSLGGTYTNQGLSLTADAWYKFGTDIIDWVYTPADTRRPYHATNQQTIHSAGTELTATYRPSAISHQPSALGQWLRQVKLSYAYTWLDLNLHEAQSRYLDYLSHKLVFSLEHGLWVSSDPKKIGVLAASWTLRWQQREGDYTSAEGIVTSYQPVLLLDGALYWLNERVKISAECTNITNRHYYDYGSLLMPGAWGTMTIQLQL